MLACCPIEAVVSEPNAPAMDLADRVILLVEDERSLLAALASFLRRKGITVIEAESGDEALQFLMENGRVDLVLSDIEMPGSINGVGLAQWIKDNRPALPVVLTSGRQSAALPGVSFLLKPYSLGELLPIIEGAGTRA
jgi:DNA-binding NtrC family response regulator